MNSAVAHASGTRAALARVTTDAEFSRRPVPARPVPQRLRPSQLPIGSGVSQSAAGMRPSQVPVASSGGSAAAGAPSGRNSLVSSPDASAEHVAGDLGDAALGISGQVPAGSIRTAVQRMCTECEEEEKKPVQAKSAVDAPREASPVLDVVGKGGGQPLAPEVRADMEGRLGADFSDVRIHTDAKAAQSAAAVSAQAYTVGSEVVFGHGSFGPESPEGQHTLAHELAHVLQQRKGPVSGTDIGGGVAVSDPSDSFEQEAEAKASRASADPTPMAANGGAPAAVTAVQASWRDVDQATASVQRACACGGACAARGGERQEVQRQSAPAICDPSVSSCPAGTVGPDGQPNTGADSTTTPATCDPNVSSCPAGTVGPDGQPNTGGDAGDDTEQAQSVSDGEAAADAVQPLIGADAEIISVAIDEDSDDADQAAVQTFATAQRQADVGVQPQANVGVRMGTFMVDPHCFGDFQGTPDKSSSAAAVTAFRFGLDTANMITVDIDKTNSWVKVDMVGDGTTRNPQDALEVGNCASYFTSQAGSYSNDKACEHKKQKCPTSVCTPVTVTSGGECNGVYGPTLDADRMNDSLRLCKHEVYHLRLAFQLAVIGNSQIAGGQNPRKVKNKVVAASKFYTALYDKQTNHGCLGTQSSWEQRIDSGTFAIDKPFT